MPAGIQSQPSTGLLRAMFGFTEFRPGQAEAIGSLADGQHTLVVMPTGAGKSLVYQYAAVARAGMAVVISPLISLMQDQVNSLTRRKIPAAYINSSISTIEQSSRLDAMARGEYRLVYVAPERLRNAAFREALRSARISLLAVDEAHCISQWGHDFRPDYLHIAEARRAMGDPLTVALTATATPRVRDDIAERLDLGPVRHIVTGFNRPNLTLRVISARDPEGKMRALAKAITGLKGGAAIVYGGTRRDAEEVAEFITETTGKHAKFYHAGLPSEERSRVQDDFMSGRMSVVAATNAFGMGIDRADVRMVIHYTIPSSLEEYYQEAGRAGRDGRPALVALLYSPQDRSLQEFFIENSRISLDDLRALHGEVKSARNGITSDDLSLALGMNQTAIRVGLAQLEMAGIVRIVSADGPRWSIEANDWNQCEALGAVGRASTQLAAKREQLEHMIDYAESNGCRRRIILDHFGDDSSADAARCCDNCLITKTVRAGYPIPPETEQHDSIPPGILPGGDGLTEGHKTAHAILDAVRSMNWEIGVGKLTKLLAGSASRDVRFAQYQKNPYFGRLSRFRQEDVKGLIDQLMETGYLKTVGGKLPVLRLSSLGEAALESELPIPLKLHRGDVVSDFLSKSHPKPLPGTWRSGWSLGFHSSFAGSDWRRSGVGQLAYQLKYHADENALAPLVREAMEVIRKNPDLADVDAIVPIPPSMKRRFDPVSSFADALARELQVEVWPAVEKVRQTKPQKEMRTLAQKRANVRGAFTVRGEVRGNKLLLVDDLFDSGATLEEVHSVLKHAGASRVPVLTLTRTIHSDG